jgi:cbb3-type cytochrome oxidase maturation protein
VSTIYFMIPATLLIAGGFLAAYIWSVRSGQFEDTCTPAMRILPDDKPISFQLNTGDTMRTLPLPVGRGEGRGEGQRQSAAVETSKADRLYREAPHPHSLPMNRPVAADVRRRTPQPLSNPPPHVGGYGSGEQIAAIGGPWNLSPSDGEREARPLQSKHFNPETSENNQNKPT